MITRTLHALLGILAVAFLAPILALLLPAPAAAQANPNFEYGIDRRGGDYRSFDLNFDAPGLCAGQCAQEGRCRAWTYVRPGVQGPKARCWLKNVVPAPTRDGNVISGLRGNIAQPPPPVPAPPPAAAPPLRAATYVGCFKDTSVFDLNGHLERSAQNTPQRCVAVCQARGFAYAAVQYGESCLCGNSYGRYGASNACNYACTGDRGQACGGYNANSVFSTGLSVAAPPPAPPPPPAVPTPPTPPAPATCGGDFALSLGANVVGPYANIPITFRRPTDRGSRNPHDWIGMAEAGSPTDKYIGGNWEHVGSRVCGTLSLKAPGAPGNYEVRFWLDNKAEQLVVRVPFTVR